MKKVISINFQGQVIAIEETAFEILTQYVESLKSYFSHEEGGDEIVNDIENRIAELFGNRLKHGINCLTDEDVEAIIAGIGKPEDFDTEYEETAHPGTGDKGDKNAQQPHFSSELPKNQPAEEKQSRSLRRDTNNKMIAGVCSGLANYFRIDPTWMRLIFVLFFSVLFWVYVVLWIVLKAEPLDWSGIKRLYRNPGDRVLGGVCGGLAAYFKIDSWIPRLIFLIPLLLSFTAISSFPFFIWDKIFPIPHADWNIKIDGGILLVYIILWIITPQAKTVKQKLEMMGEEDYIKSIRETVSDNVASVKNKAENKTENQTEQAPKVTLSEAAEAQSSGRSGCVNALILLIKIVFFAAAGFFVLILAAVAVGLLFAGFELMPLKSLFIDPGYENTLLWLSLILVLVIPIVAIMTWIVRRMMKAKFRPLIGVFALILWILGIVMAGALAMRVGEKFNVTGFNERVIELSPFNGDKLYVEMMKYPNDYNTFKIGWGIDDKIFRLPYYTENEDSLLFSNISLKVIESRDSLFHLHMVAACSGESMKLAKAKLTDFSYPFVQQDSLLLLPEFFSVPIEQGYRNQRLSIEIAMPTGKTVEIDKSFNAYLKDVPLY
ncbi:MAG: PspC domain-containing protein [Dysgonamonadaceae bacterium]|jgi:phage shock protein PspC (stress-responsive transcriptional regulator)